jgi:hypothetical protein
MLDQLLNEIRNKASEGVKREAQLDDEGVEKVLHLTKDSAQEVAQREISDGNMQSLMGLFGKDQVPDHSNPVVSKIGASLIDKLVSQMGLKPEVARSVEQIVVPLLMQVLNGKVKKDGLGSLISVFTGGKGGGILGKLGGLFG